MSKIKPARGIHPSQKYVNQVLSKVENSNLNDTNPLRQQDYLDIPLSAFHHPFFTSINKQTLIKNSKLSLNSLLEKGILIKDQKPAIYIYQITHDNHVQTGIWTRTSITDYVNGTIRKHELTQVERKKNLIKHLEKTGIEANPVLLTYLPVPYINSIILKIGSKKPALCFAFGKTTHKLWKIDDKNELEELVKIFANIRITYIADGHHRIAAATALAMRRRKLNLNHRVREEYNFFNSIYMSLDQVRILAFNRFVKDLAGLSIQEFLDKISDYFEIQKLSQTNVFKPRQTHEFGMYLDKKWYKLNAKALTYQKSTEVKKLDVSILQDYLFASILHINNPSTDTRLTCVGGIIPLETSVEQVDLGNYMALFTLFPVSIEQFIRISDAGERVPPKSTCFEPKFQIGLMTHQRDIG